MAIDLSTELNEWLNSSEARDALQHIVRNAVKNELREALHDELLDTARAADVLNMSEGALRKAVERGRIPCIRLGRRLRFRRSELIHLSDR